MEMKRSETFGSRSVESLDLDRAYDKARAVLDKSAFKEEDFRDPYEKSVDRDLAEVKRLKDRFAKKPKNPVQERNQKIGAIFEALVLWNGEQNLWFGQNAETLKTSTYDDFINGVDMVVEFSDKLGKTISHLGLAVDVTLEEDPTDKFTAIREAIEKGKMKRVKYFHSQKIHIHGRLNNLPHVILGVDKRTVSELTELWMNRQNKELAGHKIQVMILMQIQKQLEAYLHYAQTFPANTHGLLVERYTEALEKINEIIEEKKELFAKFKYDLNDAAHLSIMTFLQQWDKTITLPNVA